MGSAGGGLADGLGHLVSVPEDPLVGDAEDADAEGLEVGRQAGRAGRAPPGGGPHGRAAEAHRGRLPLCDALVWLGSGVYPSGFPHPSPPFPLVPHPPWTESALDYVQCGWLLTPLHGFRGDFCTCGDPRCAGPRQHPRHEDWLGTASDRPEVVAAWGERWEHGRVGLVLGPDSDVVTLEAQGGAAALWLRTLARVGRPLPETAEIRDRRETTATFLFRYPAGLALRRGYDVGPGLRLRTRGGYVVLPERHLRSPACRDYWHLQLERQDLPLLPSWVLEEGGAVARLPLVSSPQPPRAPAPLRLPTPARTAPPTRPARDPAPDSSPAGKAWMAAPWVPAGGLTILTGLPKLAGKTAFALSILRAVITGEPLAGVRPSSAAPPIVVLTEHAPPAFIEVCREAGLREADLERLHVLYARRTGAAPFSDVVRVIENALSRLGPSLVLIDALDRFLGPTGVREAAPLLDRLTANGSGVLALLPTPRGEGLREAVAAGGPLASSAELILCLREVPGAPPTLRLLEAVTRTSPVPTQVFLEFDRGVCRLAEASPSFRLHPFPPADAVG
jgi:hypothetical protein